LCLKIKLNSLNKYLFVSLGILGFLIILGIILGFVINEEIALVLAIIGYIVCLKKLKKINE
jgi:multisubunit Na+/H+ antiporter MnhF subunit